MKNGFVRNGFVRNGFVRAEMSPGLLQSFRDISIADTTLTLHTPKRLAVDDAVIPKMDTATRRLCSGTYLDRDFRQRLLRDIYNNRKRRVAPSYGYDLVHVLRHAWRAWWLELARDAAAVALVVVALLTVPLGALLLVGLLAASYAVRAWWRVLVESARMLRGPKSYDRAHYVRGLRFRAKLAACWLVGSALVVAGAVLAMRFNSGESRLRDDLVQTGRLVALFIILFAVAGIVRQRQLDRLHGPSAAKSEPRSRRLRTLDRQQHHAVTVYSRYTPFVGSGLGVFRWSFAQRIIRKRETGQDWDEKFPSSSPPFTTSEIVEHLKKSIGHLASTEHSETRLPGLTVRDHIFIDGTYVNRIPDALSDHPSRTTLDDILAKPREEARYHIACQVKAWDGELVTTVFVHISLQGETLYVEFCAYALYPTPRRFRVIDKVGGTGPKAAVRMARRSLSELPDVLHAPRRLAAAPKQLIKAYWAQREPKTETLKRHDIGARTSAREIAWYGADSHPDEVAASRWNHQQTSYFQFLDVARHSKIIERCLLAAIEEFLKSKDVDTSEFAQRAEAILNLVDLSGSQGAQVGNYNMQSNTFSSPPRQAWGSAAPGADSNPPSTVPAPPGRGASPNGSQRKR